MTVAKEHIITSAVLWLPRTFSNGYDRLATREGGAKILRPILMSYMALLSIEAIFVSTPVVTAIVTGKSRDVVSTVTAEDMRFVWKPFIDDGADPKRLLPIANFSRAAAEYVPFVPGWAESRISSNKWTVWNAWPQFLLAVILAVTIQNVEAWAWTKKSVKDSKAEFQTFDGIKKVKASDNSVAMAKFAAAKHNQYGTNGAVIRFSLMFCLYALEFAGFRASFTANADTWAAILYGILTIFGYEATKVAFSEESGMEDSVPAKRKTKKNKKDRWAGLADDFETW